MRNDGYLCVMRCDDKSFVNGAARKRVADNKLVDLFWGQRREILSISMPLDAGLSDMMELVFWFHFRGDRPLAIGLGRMARY